MSNYIDVLLELAKDNPEAATSRIQTILWNHETQAQAIVESGVLNIIAEESVFYMPKAIENILRKHKTQAQAIVESGVLNVIPKKNPFYEQDVAYYVAAAIGHILDADETQAQAIVESGVLNITDENGTFMSSHAIEHILDADRKQATAIVESDVIRKISEKDTREAKWAIEAILRVDRAQAVSLAQKDYIIDLMQGPECSVNKLANNIYYFAKKAEERGTLEEAGFERVEGGYVSNEFNIAVSDAAPTSRRHSLMIMHGNAEPFVLAGCFNGTLDAFKEAILETHPNKTSADRIHYDQVHTMMDMVASRWTNDARPSGTAPC